MKSKYWLLAAAALVALPVSDGTYAQDSSTEDGDAGGPPVDVGGGPPDDAGVPEDGDGAGGPPLKVVPPKGRVPIGQTRQFIVTGNSEGLTWGLVDASAPEVATLSETGLLTSDIGGWVIIGVSDSTPQVVAATDTIWLAGGPTAIGSERGGRAFAAQDTLANANFPPNASDRPMIARINERGPSDLPEEAQGEVEPVAVFDFDVSDAETGEDIGGTEGFDEEVELTLSYDEEQIPEGIDEEELVIAFFNEISKVWEQVPANDVVTIDTEANTITIKTTHASFWIVTSDDDVDDVATVLQSTSWAEVKETMQR